MSFVDITRHNGDTVDQAERDNIPDWRHVRGQGDKPARRAALDWRVSLTIVLFVGCLFTYFFIRFVQFIGAINQEVSTLDIYLWGAFKVALFLTPVALLGLAVWYVYGIARAKQVIRLQNNVPVHMRDLESAQWLTHIVQPSQSAYYSVEHTWASNSKYRSLNQLALNGRNDDMPTIAELTDEQSTAIQPVPPSEWLQWVDEQPHILISAKTKSGKSVTTKAILASRIAAGEKAIVIDPHDSEWFDLPSFGGGENWNEVRAAMDCVSDEYQRRLDVRKAHKQETGKELSPSYFQRLTCVLDEANITRLNLDKGKRGEVTPWQRFATILGSGARKVNISILLLCQSANVEDIGLTKPMRENFFRLALDESTCDYLIKSEEYDLTRRKELRAALQGRTFVAMCEYRSTVYLLDRTGLDNIDTPANTKAAIWEGCDNVMLSSLLGATTDDSRDDVTGDHDDNDNDDVAASGSENTDLSSVIITHEEAAKIASLLKTLSPSQVAKKIDGYNGRNYDKCKAKVAKVQQMMEA